MRRVEEGDVAGCVENRNAERIGRDGFRGNAVSWLTLLSVVVFTFGNPFVLFKD